MIRANRMRARFHAMFAWMCLIALTFGAGAVRALSQSPAGSDGWHIPEGAAVEPNPEALNPDAIAKGRSVYRAKCQRCHGADGAGNGPEADPDHPPANLTDARRASRNPDGVLFYKIWNGRANPRCPR